MSHIYYNARETKDNWQWRAVTIKQNFLYTVDDITIRWWYIVYTSIKFTDICIIFSSVLQFHTTRLIIYFHEYIIYNIIVSLHLECTAAAAADIYYIHITHPRHRVIWFIKICLLGRPENSPPIRRRWLICLYRRIEPHE